MTKEEYEHYQQKLNAVQNDKSEEELKTMRQKLMSYDEMARFCEEGRVHPNDIVFARNLLENKDNIQLNLSEKDKTAVIRWAENLSQGRR